MMLRSMHSEWIKSRRSAIPWLLGIAPIAVAAIASFYVHRLHLPEDAWLEMLDILNQVWFAVWFPLAWGLLSGLSSQFESASGAWRALRIRDVPPSRLYASKLAVLIVWTLLSTVWLVVLAAVFGKLAGISAAMPWPEFAVAFCTGWIASLPLLIASLWLAEGLSWAIAVGFGVFGILVASLIGATRLGIGVWQFIPWSWPIRLTYFVYQSMAHVPGMEITSGMLALFWSVLAASIGISAIIGYCSIKWFHGREVK